MHFLYTENHWLLSGYPLHKGMCIYLEKHGLLLPLTAMFPFLIRNGKKKKNAAAVISFLKEVSTLVIPSLYSAFGLIFWGD